MKALEKDRTRRYETANGFAADVLRHLAHEPVLAAPPSRAYRLRKFVRKHRGAVIAASLVAAGAAGRHRGDDLGADPGRPGTQPRKERERRGKADEALKKEAERVKERDAAVKAADARADELKYRLGVSDLVLASAAYDNRDVVLAAERLDNVPPEQRGWEWRYLKRQTRGGLFTLYGHTGAVTSVAFSPDGTRIVTGSEDRTAKVWDARTGTALLELKGHTGAVTQRGVQPGRHADRHRRVATGRRRCGTRGRARPCSTSRGTRAAVISVAFSPDGTRIVTGSRGQDGEGVGRADGHGPARAQGAHGRGDERGVQPGRRADRHRQWGPDGEGVGRADGHGPARAQGAHGLV